MASSQFCSCTGVIFQMQSFLTEAIPHIRGGDGKYFKWVLALKGIKTTCHVSLLCNLFAEILELP